MISILTINLLTGLFVSAQLPVRADLLQQVKDILKEPVLKQAAWAMQQQPVTVTASFSERSAGGKHDFFSEGDYWWPNPKHPDSPYVQKDGQTNPDNFTTHREAMIRLSRVVGSLATAYILTKDKRYAERALQHCKAWFVDTATRMTPHLLYAQAIKGRVTGRGIGIIDAIHLMEVVKGLEQIAVSYPATDKQLLYQIKKWFAAYLRWVTTHPYGKDEMNARNNHGTCWVMQVAVFARFTGSDSLVQLCRDRFKNVLLPIQMTTDGSFPLELGRTKPYGYSIFNLDAMATICQALSTPADNLWKYETEDGKSMQKAITFLFPFIQDKSRWTYPKDVMYWSDWPVAQPFLVFGALAFANTDWLSVWKISDHEPTVGEVLRNLPVRNPLIWYNIK